MIGAALNHRIEGLQIHLGLIQEQRDSAPEEDNVVNGFGAVHHRMPAGIDLTMHCPCLRKLLGRSPLCLRWSESFWLGGYLKQAEDRAGSWRLQPDRLVFGLPLCRERGRDLIRKPEIHHAQRICDGNRRVAQHR